MKELVETIAKALVDHPDEVEVTETQEGRSIHIKLKVAPEDMGKVIGKQGRIAKAIRAVVKAASTKDNTHVDVDIDD
ncbi:MAG: KH domain-containing protein [Lachnospiraceae bacterium]|nr:KH domain-containing protein [Lachnospiraceae bacterium]MCH4027566.1 KH domain-containing protein [Lachnospiraceae bacterium]MCH4065406.1 KH domain-containing protein [Lachnospiraceae bacterium]MCH4111446.1 KH domain-containing protein [Lachnospiraceae bacterium]MCI1353042.1 KH domain-containing protein [Lachnospiraceae bacterium]